MRSYIEYFLILFYAPLYSQWDNISIQTPTTFTCLSFNDQDVGFVAGGKEIYKTVNGGEDWDLSFAADTFVQLDDILVIDDTLVLCVGQDFKSHETIILRSVDSGINWDLIENDFTSYLTSLFFIDSQHGYAVGHNNYVFNTEDAGLNWTETTSNAQGNTFFESIFFSNSKNGYLVGGLPDRSNYCRSTDGGVSWEEFPINSNGYLQSVFFLDSLRGYIVGWNGEILATDDAGETWSHQVSVNMDGNLEILFTNDSTGYIVGGMQKETSIQKTTDNGMNWKEVGPDLNKGLIGIDFPSEDVGYAVGFSGTILKTINGGTTNIDEFKNEKNLFIYPNPVNTILNIQSDDLIREIEIYDTGGNKLETATIQSYNYNKNVSAYPAGYYFVLIKSGPSSGVYRFAKF